VDNAGRPSSGSASVPSGGPSPGPGR
jgi:hypothetical protein